MQNTRNSSVKSHAPRGGSRRPSSRPFSGSQSRKKTFTNNSKPTNSRSRGRKKEQIDVNQFVRAAEPVKKSTPYVPTHQFKDFGFIPSLTSAVMGRGFVNPSPIQDQAIPESLKGRDVLGVANTGTGKTAAFLLPIINSLLQNKKQQAIILAPTRELALQIKKEFQDFTKREMGLYACAVVGGAPSSPQIRDLKRGVHIVIGTPGRTQDMIRRGFIKLNQISHIVLDEVDQMLDMGFVKEITSIIEAVPEGTQKYFFSATLAPNVNKLIDGFLTNPARVLVKTQDTSKNVDQNIVRMEKGASKIDTLELILKKKDVTKTLVFAETKRSVQQLSEDLQKKGFACGSLHGDKRQRERVKILDDFKQDKINILIATDVAARGLDVPDVSHVINYEIPQTYDTYIHRIGRTGRADKKGSALTFIK